MAEAVLGLGGNLGARSAALRCALLLLADTPGCRLLARSRLYETPPMGPPQPDYFNAAVRVSFAGAAIDLLARTQQIELLLGRERGVHWGARTLDIDVLHWSDGPVHVPGLEVPHPGLGERAFALAPLLDVAPELADVWSPRLSELGGAPPYAARGWLAPARDAQGVTTPWLDDEAELASLIPELVARMQAPLARASHTLAFAGSSVLMDGQRCWLVERVNEAHARGFHVRSAAVLRVIGAHLHGVLIGAPGPCQSLPPYALVIEQRGDGARRAQLRADAPDHGPDFAESITM